MLNKYYHGLFVIEYLAIFLLFSLFSYSACLYKGSGFAFKAASVEIRILLPYLPIYSIVLELLVLLFTADFLEGFIIVFSYI